MLLIMWLFSINEAGGFEQRSKAEQKKKAKCHRKKGMFSVMSVVLSSCGKDGGRSRLLVGTTCVSIVHMQQQLRSMKMAPI